MHLAHFKMSKKNFLYLGGGAVLLQQKVAQLLVGVERTRTEGRCSWGWARTDEGFKREGVNEKKTFSFGHCPNYLTPPP